MWRLQRRKMSYFIIRDLKYVENIGRRYKNLTLGLEYEITNMDMLYVIYARSITKIITNKSFRPRNLTWTRFSVMCNVFLVCQTRL